MLSKPYAVTAVSIFLAGAATAQDMSIIVQSTTSTANSGLYDYLLPIFQETSGIQVNVVAVGTGQAIKNAQNCDGDVLLVHAKASEEKFVADGFGVKRFDVMYNDFVLVGPKEDPAGIKGKKEVSDVLKMIAKAKAPFASRGDDSGTNKKERSLWKGAGIDADAASGAWYRETGSGMGATLNAAAGMGAYTMTDRGTWISFKNRRGLALLSEGDKQLFNQYGIALINKAKHPHVKEKPGQAFVDWVVSAKGQAAIGEYKISGQQLFFPNAK